MRLLANIMTEDNPWMETFARGMRNWSPVSPVPALIIFGLVAAIVIVCLVWCSIRRQRRAPGPRILLGRAGRLLGLSPAQRRCLMRLGRQAELEPAAALVSPRMMMELVGRAEARRGKLGADDARQVAGILDIVTAACDG
ncbi:MAG: hypothetical protein GX591_03470 [Planctomycetes bacterium]|nr:hypothetical protein [Planctomycetota bacterium]